ncbi:hypothetical protein [Streptomyces sp. NBC_01565]|uniref:hypothetical protein n=1 Tax=unclassified Streptomyces TaxID=2593676 RepID=UPI002257A602|nr:hypothetical protein [Streptomyces sp. NBC_01565]MCX4545794.1 hypothetical protein [Streptomyces sp. NBC_01565]
MSDTPPVRPLESPHLRPPTGLLAHLAADDVHQARVFGRCEPHTGIDPFMNLGTQVMTIEPYADAKRVFWVVDNGSSHRGRKAADRLTAAHPNAVLVHTPGARLLKGRTKPLAQWSRIVDHCSHAY